MTHIFKGAVNHNKTAYVKGQACPAALVEEMQGKGLVEPLPEAVKPVPAPIVPTDPRAGQEAIEKARQEASEKAKAEAVSKAAKG